MNGCQSFRRACSFLGRQFDLLFNRRVGLLQSFIEWLARNPSQFFADQQVVRFSSTHAKGAIYVVDRLFLSGDFHDHTSKLIDGHHLFGDNRVPGDGQEVRASLTREPELDHRDRIMNERLLGVSRPLAACTAGASRLNRVEARGPE